MNDEQKIEQMLQEKGLNAPRLDPDYIDSMIVAQAYHVFPGSNTTICLLTLKNGFTVLGESACASPANFNRETGQYIAFRAARAKIWALEGYRLKQMLHDMDSMGERIAEIAHEVNRSYCGALGDTSQAPWPYAPQWQKESAIKGVMFHLAEPDAGPEASHNSWLAEKEADGWKYGKIKDPDKKEHPCYVPYAELPSEQKAKDYIFTAIVHCVKELFNYR